MIGYISLSISTVIMTTYMPNDSYYVLLQTHAKCCAIHAFCVVLLITYQIQAVKLLTQSDQKFK